MQKKNNQPSKRTTGYFLMICEEKAPELFPGVELANSRFGPAFVLPKNSDGRQKVLSLDRQHPPHITECGKVCEFYLRTYAGKKIHEAGAIITIAKPAKETTNIIIVTDHHWSDLGVEIIEGFPNGSLPGIQVMKDGDIVKFTHGGKDYKITNFMGEPQLAPMKFSGIEKKEKKEKAEKQEEVIDARIKIEEKVTVVAKVALPEKKVAPVAKPAEKQQQAPAPKNNRKDHNPGEEVKPREVVPATARLSAFAGGDKLAKMMREMTQKKKQGSGKRKAVA